MNNPYEIDEYTRSRYFLGWKNKLIRIYFYLREGLNLLNEFKYLVAGILAAYYATKMDNLYLMGLMFVVAVPLLILIGYIWVYRAKKSMEWFGIEHTTFFGKYGYQLQERQIALLEEILANVKNSIHRT